MKGERDLIDLFTCRLTGELMIEDQSDPVLAADGYTYQRSAIENYFRGLLERGQFGVIMSPVTGQPLQSLELQPNLFLIEAIRQLAQALSEEMGQHSDPKTLLRNIVKKLQDKSAPEEMRCKLTNYVMSNPVMAADGYSYQKETLENYLKDVRNVNSPVTKKPLLHRNMTPNRALKKGIVAREEAMLRGLSPERAGEEALAEYRDSSEYTQSLSSRSSTPEPETPPTPPLPSASLKGIFDWKALQGVQPKIAPELASGFESLAFSGDGKWIALGDRYGVVQLRDARTGVIQQQWEAHGAPIKALDFSFHFHRLAVGGGDTSIQIWDIQQQKLSKNIQDAHDTGVHTLLFSSDSLSLFSAARSSEPKVWDCSNFHVKSHFLGLENGDWMNAINISADGRWLVGGSQMNQIYLWNTTHEKVLERKRSAHDSPVKGVAISLERKWSAHDSPVKGVAISLERKWSAHDSPVKGVAISFDNHFVASFSESNFIVKEKPQDNAIWLWDFNGQLVHQFEGHTRPVTKVIFFRGQYANLMASCSMDGTFRIWNIFTKECIASTTAHFTTVVMAAIAGFPEKKLRFPSQVENMAISPDHRTIVSIGGGGLSREVCFWDISGVLAGSRS